MKLKDIAKELKITESALYKMATSMGINIDGNDEINDLDVKALKNALEAKNRKSSDTKIVRARPKKNEDEDSGPKVVVKKAKGIDDVKPRARGEGVKVTEKSSASGEGARRTPIGKPVPKSETAARSKPHIGKPVPKKPVKEDEGSSATKKPSEEQKTQEVEVAKEVRPKAAEPTPDGAVGTNTADAPKGQVSQGSDSGQKVPEQKKEKSADVRDVPEQEVSKEEKKGKAKDETQKETVHRGEKATVKKDENPRRPGRKAADKAEREGGPQGGASGDTRKKKQKRDKDKDKKRSKFDRMDQEQESGRFGLKSLEKKQKKKFVKQPKAVSEPEVEEEPLPAGTKVINVPITIAGFCEQVGVSIPGVILALLKLGVVANQNQNIDEDTVLILAKEMGINVVIGKVEEEEAEEGIENFEDREKDLEERAPIITVMGHVDHGKTSLLDAIRKTNVTASESGGITQHIGASEVEIDGKKIVFLDTPGHEAFTAMRARGADITDIAVLVVAADDSVKPQTIESISHAKAAGVPIIVAINKMDKPGANPDRVKQDLAEHNVLVEEWGGDVICVPVSAKSGEGIVNLLEMILLQAEVLELRANPNRLAMGTVLEARLDKAKGPVATLLVINGTLKTGQSVVAGVSSGRIRLMTDAKGRTIRKAGPATAVEILGLTDVPAAGDRFNAVSEDRLAKEIAEKRKLKQREEIMARTSSTTLEELFSQIKEGEKKELNLIIKGDVMGSVGAVSASLEKLSNENVVIKIIHSGVGAITESDVTLAGTSSAIIIGFNVRPSAAVTQLAERENVQIRTYRVIYDIIDDVKNAMEGMLDPEFKEVVLGECEVRTTFKVPNVGTVAGAYVTSGKMVRNAEVRLIRDGIVIHEGKIGSLKRFKDDAREVEKGFECGLGIEGYNDIKEGDIIECFRMEEVEKA